MLFSLPACTVRFVSGGPVPLPGTNLAQSTVAGLSLTLPLCLEGKGMLLPILSLGLKEKFFLKPLQFLSLKSTYGLF